MSNKRALDATRVLLSSRDRARPLHHLEAIKLERSEQRRAELIEPVAKMLAAWPDSVEAAEEIVEAYFTKKPPGAEKIAEADSQTHELMRARARNLLNFEDELAEFPAPGQRDECPGEVGRVAPGGGRRSLGEIESAVAVLGLAVRYSMRLTDVVGGVAKRLRKWGMSVLADKLDDSIAAAGTLDPFGDELLSHGDRELVERAILKGRDPDRALHFSRQYDELAKTGNVKVKRRTYVESLLASEDANR